MQAIGVTERQQAKPLVAIPDLLTVIRVPAAVAFLALDGVVERVVILVIVAVSDVADGMLARRLGGSRAGVVLDPVVDKLFMLAAFAAVLRGGALSLLEVGGVLLRDILAGGGFLVTLMLRRPTTLPARAGGKAVTVCQLLTLVAFVAHSDLVRPLAWATAAISVYAVADYGRVGWTR